MATQRSSPQSMKAVAFSEYGPPEVLKLIEMDRPSPEDDEVLIRIDAFVATAADDIMRSGKPFVARLPTGLRRPRRAVVPGSELAGVVESVGKDVGRFQPGDSVVAATGAGFGAYAEYVVVAEDGAMALQSTNLTSEEAVAVAEGALTALTFLRDAAQIRSGHKVLVNGASGSVGTAAVQLAKYYGAEVTGVSSTTNLSLVESLGADRVIDYTQQDFTTAGETYDIIFDAVGKSSFRKSKGALALRGTYLTTVPSVAIALQTILTPLLRRKTARIAFAGLRKPVKKAKDLVFLKELTDVGKLRPVVDRTYPMEQIVEAHTYVATGHKKGNVVITVDH